VIPLGNLNMVYESVFYSEYNFRVILPHIFLQTNIRDRRFHVGFLRQLSSYYTSRRSDGYVGNLDFDRRRIAYRLRHSYFRLMRILH